MSKLVQANYDRMSRWYDLFASSEKKFTAAGVQLLDVQSGERVLEIGCGTGHALSWLKQAAGPGLTMGADLSAGMLREARNRVSGEEIPLIQTDVLALPILDGSFDVVFLSFTLELFPLDEIPQVLAACKRILKPDGRLGLVCMAVENTPMVKLYNWAHRRWPVVLDCRPIETQSYLEQAGFKPLKTDRQTMWSLPVDILVSSAT